MSIAQRVGVQTIPWLKFSFYLTLFYACVTCLKLFYRPDFLDLTIVVSAIFMLTNAYKITSNTFRGLVIAIIFSLFYDIFWFGIKSNEYKADQKDDGGLQGGIRMFSLYMSYISFFVRIFMALVYWKDSLDFQKMTKQRSSHRGPTRGQLQEIQEEEEKE
mmetsp:Transcript_28750/g.27713  ORF Transcript_28750/g.27713 Transcript_28750/m.27713 type:complete len:160 (+) Transcript_28750:118-597(+)